MRKRKMGYIYPRRIKDTMAGNTTVTSISTYVADEETKQAVEAESNRKQEREKILQEARQPWFCPKCGHIMSKRQDSKYWYRYGKCMDCVLLEEDEMKLKGEYTQKVTTVSIQNFRRFLEDSKISIEEYMETLTGEWKVAREDGTVEIVKTDPEREKKMLQDELDYINKQLMILDASTPEEEAELLKQFTKEMEKSHG